MLKATIRSNDGVFYKGDKGRAMVERAAAALMSEEDGGWTYACIDHENGMYSLRVTDEDGYVIENAMSIH